MKVLCYMPQHPSTQNKVGMLVRSAGMPFFAFQQESEIRTFVDSEPDKSACFIFTHESNLALVHALSLSAPASPIVLILESPLQKIAQHLVGCRSVQCFVATHNDEVDARDVMTMLKKFKTGDIAGLDKYLGFSAEIHAATLHNAAGKRSVLDQVETFVRTIGGDAEAPRFDEYSRRVCELLDELVLNAIFDANPRLARAPRGLAWTLADHEAVRVEWGFDGDTFGLSVVDRFGSLSKETVLAYLDETFVKRDLHLQQSAGLGLKLIFDRMHQFIVNIRPESQTEIICLLRFDKRLREFEARIRSFHFFEETERAS